MPRFESAPSVAFAPTALLRVWIALGLLSLCFVPWQNAYVGWLPYWLVIAPAISLALLRRERWVAAARAHWRQPARVKRSRRNRRVLATPPRPGRLMLL